MSDPSILRTIGDISIELDSLGMVLVSQGDSTIVIAAPDETRKVANALCEVSDSWSFADHVLSANSAGPSSLPTEGK